ncbi:hypothetical protein [Rhodoplanes sp. Z2-YC6860]|uniref:hypothetical protein n=1 Tax=Rhodoplanes sp. Z2-YC6860 TaxID=674703 RepID=UPI0008323865|nr:hypothetical protein [Rhodoplanes sp. Z2-YC6860]
MSKNTVSLMIAAFAFSVSASSAFADNVKHTRQQTRAQQENAYNARASAATSTSTEWTYGAREPFTAAEKRAFQTPTGAEVDRW